ncbi:MAG: amidohydrolase [Bryobacteraceae bacterium]
MRRGAIRWLAFLAPVVLGAQPAETIYINGRVTTVDAGGRVAEAFAVRDGRFVGVGSTAEIRKMAGPGTQVVDLKGRNVLPGLIDSHTHPISAALSERDGPVPVMRSIPEIQEYIGKLARTVPEDGVIFVPKIYASRLKERRYPRRAEIDAAAPGRVAMTDNGYASVLSTAALRRAGIGRETPEPANGKIIRGPGGEPTGLILGAPQLLTPLRGAAAVTPEDMLNGLRAMQRAYNRVGITSTIDRGQRAEGFRTYLELQRRGELSVRTYVTYLISASGKPEDVRREIESIPFVTGFGDDWVRVGSLKTVADGGILIGTAYLREPYGEHTELYGYKDPDYRGNLSVARENLIEMARTANRSGWQMTAHVAGGGAIDALLDAYEAADKERSIQGRRFTLTHANFPNKEAIARSKRLGAVLDCQPAWHHYDGPAIKDVFGPARMEHFLPLRWLLDAGVTVAGGSDHMIRFDDREAINPYNPFFGMWMAVTRKTADGSVLQPEQRITREEALRMWTVNSAYLSFEEKAKGSIETGKLADFVVVDRDILACPVDEMKDAEVLMTAVGGKVVYRKEGVE